MSKSTILDRIKKYRCSRAYFKDFEYEKALGSWEYNRIKGIVSKEVNIYEGKI